MNRVSLFTLAFAAAGLASCAQPPSDVASASLSPCASIVQSDACLQARQPPPDENVARGRQPDYPPGYLERQARDVRSHRPATPPN